MLSDFSWKVGGQQGEGIESTGEIFASALHKMGYFLYGYRHFSSRIKGGHTNNKIRVSTKPVYTVDEQLHLLVAFDQETIDLNASELCEQGIVIADAKFNPVLPENLTKPIQLCEVPFSQMASEHGNALMKNMVAIGASAAVLNLPLDLFDEMISEKFLKKGERVIQANQLVIKEGFSYIKEQYPHLKGDFELADTENKHRLSMIGNEAIALGALAAGVRLMPAYPITPASEIMEYLIQKLPDFGGTVIQTEDEIAAVTMSIGASYAGVRSFTASAGPGLSLMMEAIGLSGMVEMPLVVVNTQRGGPSTGLPTKQEQSDLMAMIYGTHGEIPKIVLAPSTVEEAFYDTVEAFNLADRYQCPVILLSDLQLSLGKQTTERFDFERVTIERGKIQKENLPELENKDQFKRYEVTEDGVSTRTVPGVKNGLHHVTGVEHNEIGRPSEQQDNRKQQMDKRLRKVSHLATALPIKTNLQEESDVLLVGFGSTYGAIQETTEKLRAEGVRVSYAQVRQIHPFPTDMFEEALSQAKKVIVIENNATSQLGTIIKQNTNKTLPLEVVLKYDGNPFSGNEVYQQVKGMMENGNV